VSTPLFAGVDGGGTKTAIVVVDADGNEIARDITTTSNSAVIGHERAAATLRELIQSVATRAGATLPFQAIWCGLSGSDRPEDHRRLRPHLEDLAVDLQMTNDAELAIGGLPNRVGIAIVSGTGSIAFGRNASRTRARAGGWGHIFGDQGSGYDVARRALAAFAAEADGYGPKTSLTERLTSYWDLPEPHTIINRVYDPMTTKGDIARLSPIVVEEAAKGDDVSRHILAIAASDLATFARAAARRLELGPELALALVGGMLVHVEPFRQQVLDDLAQDWEITYTDLVVDPALTAARSLAASWKGVTA
jgi:glucosamine kinase